MKKLLFTWFVLFISFTLQSNVLIPPLKNIGIEVPHEDFVYFLDDSNFDKVINNEPIIVVKFFTSSIDHLIVNKLDFDIAAKISATKINVPFAIVELDTSPKLNKVFGNLHNPCIKVFLKGSEMDFYGPYGPEDMVSVIEKYKNANFSKSSERVSMNENQAIEIVKNHKISAILIYHNCPRSDYMRKQYLAALPVLTQIYDFPLFLFDDKKSSKLKKKYNIKTIPEILICYRANCYQHENHHLNILDLIPNLISLLNNEHKIDRLEELEDYQSHYKSKLAPHFLAIINNEDSKEFEVIEHMFVAHRVNTPIFYSTNKSIIALIGCEGAKQCLRIHFPPDVGLPDDEELIIKELLRDKELIDEHKVADYIMNHTFPLVSYKHIFDNTQFRRYMRQTPKLIYFGNFGYDDTYSMFSNEQIERTLPARKFLVPLAKKHRGIKFTVSSNNYIRDEAFLTHDFHLDEVILIIDEYNLNYFMDENKQITVENIDQFIVEFNDGKIEPTVSSLEEPRVSHFYGFQIAVGKTLKKYATDNTRDTFLILPQDIHTFKISFKHEIDVLNQIIEGNGLVNPIIMQIKGNHVPSIFGRMSALNIFLLPSGNIKNFIKYEGQFTAFGIFEFLKNNGELSLKGWDQNVMDEL